MTRVTFEVMGNPRGKGAPRATVRGAHAAVYQDKETRAYEKAISVAATLAMAGAQPTSEALILELGIYFPIPASTRKRDVPLMLDRLIMPTKKPDTSNVAKAVEDGCNGIVYVDDCQIVRIIATKAYALQPRVWVRFSSWAA